MLPPSFLPALRGMHRPLPGMETAPLQPPTPWYLLQPTKDQLAHESQASPSSDSINSALIHLFLDVPSSYQEAMSLLDEDKWQKACEEEFKCLAKMGIWQLVDHPSNPKTIKCRCEMYSKLQLNIALGNCIRSLYSWTCANDIMLTDGLVIHRSICLLMAE